MRRYRIRWLRRCCCSHCLLIIRNDADGHDDIDNESATDIKVSHVWMLRVCACVGCNCKFVKCCDVQSVSVVTSTWEDANYEVDRSGKKNLPDREEELHQVREQYQYQETV